MTKRRRRLCDHCHIIGQRQPGIGRQVPVRLTLIAAAAAIAGMFAIVGPAAQAAPATDAQGWMPIARSTNEFVPVVSYHLPVDDTTPISGGFGAPGPDWPGGHAGIDFNGETGDPIYAATNGRVFYAEFNYGGYGNLVMIHRADGVETRYAHLSRILVKKGAQVYAGQMIGRMGETGDASGSHLHFEVRVGKVPTPTDPASLWSGPHPGVPTPPPAWSCRKYGC